MTAPLLNPQDIWPRNIWPDGPPDSDPSISAIRARVFSDGLSRADFQRLMAGDAGTFQYVFGENVLLKVEFDVARLGEHSHLVHVPPAPESPQIISAYPADGKLRVHGPSDWTTSAHSPLRRADSIQRIGVIAIGFDEPRWRRVSILAKAIDEAQLNYNFLFQNSNSVVATLAHTAQTGFVDLPGGGFNLGSGNLLYDELTGSRQVPALMLRGGMSHSGAFESPVSRHMPDSANTEG